MGVLLGISASQCCGDGLSSASAEVRMSDTYTKVFSSITESTVWGEPYATRVVWVTMLAMADARGNVYGAIPGLARRANVTLEEVQAALAAFMAPDPFSRTKDQDGRRIEEIDGGWSLINHGKYSAVRNAEERREYKREWDRKNRSKSANPDSDTPTESDRIRQNPTNTTGAATPALTPALEKQKQKTAPEGDFFVGIDPRVVTDFKALRSKLRAPITPTAMAGITREAQKAGITLQAAMTLCCERGWRGFKADWLDGKVNGHRAPSGYQPLPGEI